MKLAGANACFTVLAFCFATSALAAPKTLSLEAAQDTQIKFDEPARNFNKNELLGSVTGQQLALFRFDLTKLPRNTAVLSAKLTLTFESASGSGAGDVPFAIYLLSRDFSEDSATFQVSQTGQPWAAAGLAKFRDYATGDLPFRAPTLWFKAPAPLETVLTPAVREAALENRPALNLVLICESGGYAGGRVYSHRTGDAAKRPRLEIVYEATAPRAIAGKEVVQDKFGPPLKVDGSASSRPDGSKNNLAYLWTVDTPAPGSTFSPGQIVGRTAAASFDPDVPGQWRLRLRVTDPATREFTEDTVYASALAMHSHPRLGLDEKFLAEIAALRKTKQPVWMRFQDWLDGIEKGGNSYVVSGNGSSALLLGYQVTKEHKYFDLAWKETIGNLYRNGKDRSQGVRPFFGRCPEANYCDEHAAATQGSLLIMQMSILYDWGYDAFSPNERADLLGWLTGAINTLYYTNPNLHTHFRNDGAAMVLALSAATYSAWGETSDSLKWLAWFREEWRHTQEALDVMGRGGAMAEGNAYGEGSATELIIAANLVYYASGENLFLSHPFFQRHLAYDAFTAYPHALQDSDDPMGHSNPPQLFIEGAALGGDDDRGYSWHSFQLRPNGLALVRRFPGTEEADIWNWVFRQANSDRSVDAWTDVFLYSPPPALPKPKRLSLFDPGMGYVYLRSDWNSRDATWISSWAGPHLDLHQHLDQGAFTIFKRRDLAIKSGNYDFSPLTAHVLAYSSRSVSANTLLVGDPHEVFDFFIAGYGCDADKTHTTLRNTGLCIPNDGGERTMSPYSLSLFSLDEYFSHRDDYDVARVAHFEDNGRIAAWTEDITNAYSNPRWTSPWNHAKVTKVYRRFVYLREPDLLIVSDTVASTDPQFQKSWLLHTADHFEVGGTAREISKGEVVYTGGNEGKIVVDDKQPAAKDQVTSDLRAGFAQLLFKTLSPGKFQYHLVGGREPSKTSHMAQYQDDPKSLEGGAHPNHFHTHIKDFWVMDYSEGVLKDHKSFNWAPVYPQEMQRADYEPVFSGGYGRWRLELQPTEPSKTDYFLNVLKPSLNPADKLPEMTRIEDSDHIGVSIVDSGKTWKITFPKETLDLPAVEIDGAAADLIPPAITRIAPVATLPAGTKESAVTLKTTEPAVCRYSFRAGTMFPYMTGAFTTSDGLQHTLRSPNLTNGDTYTYFVRCQDKAGNENLEDLRVTFSVQP